MGTVDTHSSGGRGFSRRRVATSSAVVAATALAAVFAGSTGNAQAAPSFTSPTQTLSIGTVGHAYVYPFGMTYDSFNQTLLVDDYNNYDVRQFSLTGVPLLTFGSKGKKPGQFSEQPSEIAANPTDGSFVVAFAFNGDGYMKFDVNGKFLFQVTTPVAYYAPFIAESATGETYLVQSTGLNKSAPNIVLMYDSNGHSLGQFGTNGTNCSKGQFGVIRGIDVDSFGNVFVNDVSNHCVQVFSSTGKFETSFGTRTQLSANTRGLKVDKTNHVVYIADAAKEDVVAYNFTYSGTNTVATGTLDPLGPIGTPGLSVGSACGGNGELDAPRDIAVGPDGTVFVSDYACWIVDSFHPLFDSTDGPGTWINQMPDPSQPAAPGGLNSANGVAVSQDGSTVYVADTFNQRIQEFNGPTSTVATTGAPGSFVQQWGSRLPTLDGPFSMDYPRGVAIDPITNNVWVSDTRSGYIKEYTTTNSPPSAPTVTFDQDFGGEGINPGQFFYSDAITVAPGPPGDPLNFLNPETLYIPDSGIGYFQVMQDTTGNGNYQTVAEFPCGILVEPDVFNGCTGSAVDALGNIYAADFNEGTVQVFSPTIGSAPLFLPTYALTQTIMLPGSKPLGGPYGVAISGNTMYVTQSTKNSVSAFDITTPTAAVWLGTWGTKGTGNGQLNRPLGIATDGLGNIYVDDYGNSRISVFTPAP